MSKRGLKAEHFFSQEHRARAGREYENSLFGKADIDNLAYRRKLDQVARPGRDGGKYVSYAKAMDLAREFQQGEATNPSTDFLRELRLAILEILDIQDDKQADLVKAYTAVGTPLDTLHGVDAFIVISHDGHDIPVTLDATLREDKAGLVEAIDDASSKADIVIRNIGETSINEDEYLRVVEQYAREVVKAVYRKIEEEINMANSGRKGKLRKSPPPQAKEARI